MAKAKEEGSIVMFDQDLLKDIDLSKGEGRLHECGLSIDNPGDNLLLRPLCSDDYEKGFPAIQNNLARVGDVTKDLFLSKK
ncbi:glucosamine 6-phosphate N-acetyltransferase-like [Porites lutea]|uniref:glucosamine 6-phosphate N-acetyltransferase-like n=1 Tax=Porites lutea TaxID=51062 RepID=UPI003CC680EB